MNVNEITFDAETIRYTGQLVEYRRTYIREIKGLKGAIKRSVPRGRVA